LRLHTNRVYNFNPFLFVCYVLNSANIEGKSSFEQELNDEFDGDLRIGDAFTSYAKKCRTSVNESSVWYDGAVKAEQEEDDDFEMTPFDHKKRSEPGDKSRKTAKISWTDLVCNSSSDDDESIAEEGVNKAENDAMLYDPNADDKDQAFVNALRASATYDRPSKKRTAKESDGKKPLQGQLGPTDAILNCPCCMTQLCLDCQRHQTFLTQYRAMFVHNCRVDESNEVSVPEKRKRRKLSRREREDENKQCEEKFYSVLCEICCTSVGAFDVNELVYHFYNVIASHS
jgi:hypothetical protein